MLVGIGAAWSVTQVVDQLRGWIDRIARDRGFPIALTAETLTNEVALVAKYLSEPIAVQRRWEALRTCPAPLPPTTIAVQSWRDVQPDLVDKLGSDANERVVFTAAGGVGKSFLLGQMHAASTGERVWLDAQAMTLVDDALRFGAWACAQRGRRLQVFVDALDLVSAPGAVLVTIDRAINAYPADVFVAARATTWAPIRESMPRWRELRLSPWNAQHVRNLVHSSRPQQVPDDLVELLRTPLLLDLFLRTFGASEPPPAGLATRHGLLRAYFERRVLPVDDPSASERRRALDRGSDSILANATRWTDGSEGARQLLGEGVLVASLGELTFRHALLRDFAVALSFGRSDATDIATRLAAVANPTTRNDLLRSLVEARLDPSLHTAGPSSEEIIVECAAMGIAAGIAIGSTDVPTVALIGDIAPLEGGHILRQAVTRAQVIGNTAWIDAVAAIGGTRPKWLGSVQLDAVARLAEFATSTSDPSSTALARTLRGWTLGEANDSWAMTAILKLIVAQLRDNVTLAWLGSLESRTSAVGWEALEWVTDMLLATPQLDPDAALGALVNLVFGAEPSRTLQGHERHAIVERCLRGRSGKRGLLRERPKLALPIVFELSARDTEEENRRRRDRMNDPKMLEAMAKLNLALAPVAPDLLSAQERLQRLPMLSEEEAWRGLVDDMPAMLGGYRDEVEGLLDDVRELAADPQTRTTVAAAATLSRSVRARILALSALDPASDNAVGASILGDARVYHSVYAQQDLHAQIIRFWPYLGPNERRQVQSNILEIARSPALRVSAVGRIATAIPRDELDPALLPYIQFLEETDRSFVPVGPSRMVNMRDVSSEPDDGDEAAVVDANAAVDPFQTVLEEAKKPSSEEAARAVAALIDGDCLDVATPGAVWFAVSNVLNHDERAKTPRVVSGQQARRVFELALANARSDAARSEVSLWTTLIDIADAGAGHVANQDDAAMRERLLEEVVDAAGANAENEPYAARALMFVRPWHWFQPSGSGRSIFRRWFAGALTGEALVAGMRYLRFFDLVERIRLLRTLFQDVRRLDAASPGASSVVDETGRQVGQLCFWAEEESPRQLFAEWCAERPGVLKDRRSWRSFIDGVAWGLQIALAHSEDEGAGARGQAGIARYPSLASATWEAWPAPTSEDREAIAWALVAPLEQSYKGPQRDWSPLLRQLLVAILRTAGYSDLSAALLGLRWDSIDRQTLEEAAEMMLSRLPTEPEDGYVLYELVGALEKVGCLRTLPLAAALRIQDGLEKLGRSYPRATVAASRVENRIRLEQG